MNSENNTVMAVGGRNTDPHASHGGFLFKTAILVDGGWFSKELGHLLDIRHPHADLIYRHAVSVVGPDDLLVKFFYYDSKPYDAKETNPITKVVTDFSKSPGYGARERFFQELAAFPMVALRRGDVKHRGWRIRKEYQDKLFNGTVNSLTDNDIEPIFEQKGVDMRIGIDIATLSFKRHVNRIILFSGDTDMMPAIKLARIEGVQVVMVQVGNHKLRHTLVEHSDFVRKLSVT